MAVELSAGRIGRQMTRSNLVSEPVSERVQAAINNFVEYPAAPWRQGSSPTNWNFPDWLDYQAQKLVGKNGK